MHNRRRKPLCAQRLHHAELSIHGMGGRQKLARRLATKDIALCWRRQLVGWIGLPTLELLHRERTFKALNRFRHPAFKRCLIKFQGISNRLGSGKGIIELGHV